MHILTISKKVLLISELSRLFIRTRNYINSRCRTVVGRQFIIIITRSDRYAECIIGGLVYIHTIIRTRIGAYIIIIYVTGYTRRVQLLVVVEWPGFLKKPEYSRRACACLPALPPFPLTLSPDNLYPSNYSICVAP